MKKIILFFITASFLFPASLFAIQKFERTGKIDKDENGGYSENQRDYRSKRKAQIRNRTGAGYYNGEYHSKTKDFQPTEWQFVKPGDSSSTKHHKKKKKVETNE